MGFSIIIPVKEINDYVLESVPITLRIDYTDFEVLVLPNEMPSGPLPSCLKDPRVRVIPTGRVGPAVKRDVGAQHAVHDRAAQRAGYALGEQFAALEIDALEAQSGGRF